MNPNIRNIARKIIEEQLIVNYYKIKELTDDQLVMFKDELVKHNFKYIPKKDKITKTFKIAYSNDDTVFGVDKNNVIVYISGINGAFTESHLNYFIGSKKLYFKNDNEIVVLMLENYDIDLTESLIEKIFEVWEINDYGEKIRLKSVVRTKQYPILRQYEDIIEYNIEEYEIKKQDMKRSWKLQVKAHEERMKLMSV